MSQQTAPDNLRSPEFLARQVKQIVDFYYPACIDNELGGYINQFRDDGSIFDHRTKHLVGTCRFIYVFSTASVMLNDPRYVEAARHGIEFLLSHHRQSTGGYAWILDGQDAADPTNHCYGHAFVLLAYASAVKAGIEEVVGPLGETFDLMEQRFWDPDSSLYVDEISPDWSVTDVYRGQNANMHTCEALIAAFEATGQDRYLERAVTLAKRICIDLASASDGLIWEHYESEWTPDWNYNIDDPKNLFRPYGYLVGHWAEWAKLLLLLEAHRPEEWMVRQAKALFDAAVGQGWDHEKGGMNYSISHSGETIDTDRYYWVLSETIAAAGLLAMRTGDDSYWDWYEKAWAWSLQNLVDSERGGWYRILDANNRRYDDLKSPATKTDYHPVAACWELFQRI